MMGPVRKNDGAYFLALNRNKKSMILNLKVEEGKEIFYKLIETYDIVLEGFRPGVMDRLGIGYQELKKRHSRWLIEKIGSLGHDINYIGLGGILELTGTKETGPVIPGVQIADIGAGAMMAAFAILAAVIHRQKTGEGQHLDVAMHDGVISWLSIHAGKYLTDQILPQRGEMHLSGRYACYQVYPTKDGRYMSLGALEPKFWKNFCEAVGKKDLILKQFIEGEERIRIIEEIKNLFRTRTQKEWADFFKEVDACCEPILTLDEVFQHPQVLHREMVVAYEHPVEGEVRQVGNPIKSSLFPFAVPAPSPQWGEHTIEVLKEIGYTKNDIERFKETKAI